jgi:hypothetical protein
MFAIALALSACLGTDKSPALAEDIEAYELARVKAEGSAPEQVGLALWCESKGWNEKKAEHLAASLRLDPENATARGLSRTMPQDGQWLTPEAASAAIRANADRNQRLEEYYERRAKLEKAAEKDRAKWQSVQQRGNAAEARLLRLKSEHKLSPEHQKLGQWCKSQGLLTEAQAHFTSAIMLDPHNAAAWKQLGYVKHKDRWMTKEQIAAEAAEAELQKRADRSWGPLLEQWAAWLKRPERTEELEAHTAEVHDSRAVPSIRRVLGNGGTTQQALGVKLLSQIESPAATLGLAEFAVLSQDRQVRWAAIEALKPREKRDFADRIVAVIRAPMTYRYQPVQGPGSSGALLVETPRFRLLRTYDAPEAFRLSNQFYGYVGYDGNGLPVLIRGRELNRMRTEDAFSRERDLRLVEARTAQILAQANLNAAVTQQRLVADICDIEQANAQTQARNERAITALKNTLGAPDFKDDEDKWQTWWYEQLGYRYEAPPQVEVVQRAVPPSAVPYVTSCFIAGTPVHTLDGPRPIESVLVGDQVLSQDTTTGALSYQPVLAVHHNAPSPTVRLKLDTGETLVPSIFHRFWIAGKGWAQARELRAGDVLRTLSGRMRIDAIESGDTQPVCNLDVAGSHTFFVGKLDALVHDNSLPGVRERVFDAQSAVEGSGLSARRETARTR